MVSGVFGNVLEMDDLYCGLFLYVGDIICVVSFVVVLWCVFFGVKFLDVLVCGYEIGCWIGLVVVFGGYILFYNFGICGVFGVVIVVVDFLELDVDGMVDVLG